MARRIRKRFLLVLAVLFAGLYWSYQNYGVQWGRFGQLIHAAAALLFVFLFAEQY